MRELPRDRATGLDARRTLCDSRWVEPRACVRTSERGARRGRSRTWQPTGWRAHLRVRRRPRVDRLAPSIPVYDRATYADGTAADRASARGSPRCARLSSVAASAASAVGTGCAPVAKAVVTTGKAPSRARTRSPSDERDFQLVGQDDRGTTYHEEEEERSEHGRCDKAERDRDDKCGRPERDEHEGGDSRPQGPAADPSNACAPTPTASPNATSAPATILGSGAGDRAAPRSTYERCQAVYGGWKERPVIAPSASARRIELRREGFRAWVAGDRGPRTRARPLPQMRSRRQGPLREARPAAPRLSWRTSRHRPRDSSAACARSRDRLARLSPSMAARGYRREAIDARTKERADGDHRSETTRPRSGSPTRVYSHQGGRQIPAGTPNSTIATRPPGFTMRASSRIVAAGSSTQRRRYVKVRWWNAASGNATALPALR